MSLFKACIRIHPFPRQLIFFHTSFFSNYKNILATIYIWVDSGYLRRDIVDADYYKREIKKLLHNQEFKWMAQSYNCPLPKGLKRMWGPLVKELKIEGTEITDSELRLSTDLIVYGLINNDR